MTSKLEKTMLVLVIGGAVTMFVATPHTVVAAPTLEQQEHCAQLAKDWHDHLAEASSPTSDKLAHRLVDNYSSHWNTKIGKCLALTNLVSYFEFHNYSQMILLYDPIEAREYAYWHTISAEYPKHYKTIDTSCWMWPLSGGTILCTSREQFDGFVNSYMNE